MKVAQHIREELEEVSPLLASISDWPNLSLPDGYFVSLSKKVLEHKIQSQVTPKGYFESLPQLILERIKKEATQINVEGLSISTDHKSPAFAIPENYFEQLPETILIRCKEPQQSKILSISRKVWAYSAAAIIMCALLLGIFFMNNNRDPFKMAAKYQSEEQLLNAIDNLNPDEIISYLETNGSVVDNHLLIQNEDLEELPTSEEYLLNDEALNDYLKTINIPTSN